MPDQQPVAGPIGIGSQRAQQRLIGQGHADAGFHEICVFRESWALISRDLGHAFHAIVGSRFADAGRLADGFMGSGLIGLVKRFRDGGLASQAFSGEEESVGVVDEPVEDCVGQSRIADGLVPVIDWQLAGDDS